MKDASVFGVFNCIVAKGIKVLRVNSNKWKLSKGEKSPILYVARGQAQVMRKLSKREKIPILYVARGQAQVMWNLYVENVPEGYTDFTWHRDLLNNTLNILSSFNLLSTEPLIGIAK